MRLILASNSPRRRELLRECGYDFTVEPSLFEESAKGLSPCETARTFAEGKAEEVFSRFPHCAVLGADTVVALGGEIFGKPYTAERAKEMLRKLSGRTHEVFTGVCVLAEGRKETRTVRSLVTFHPLTEELISAYAESGLSLDKAGAYGIQDGYPIVEKYEGSYTNIVGLPVEEVREMLAQVMRKRCEDDKTCD